MKILCTGDLHLNERSWLGPEWLDKQADVWRRLCEIAATEDFDALLFAGDAFEHRRPTPREMRAFQSPLEILAEAEIPALAITGNHDRTDVETISALEVVTWESPMITHSHPGVWECGDFSVATLPWTPFSRLVAEGGSRDDVHERAAQLLEDHALGLDADILLLHWSVAGSSLPNGLPVDQLRETVLEIGSLLDSFAAIVCGHIHKPQTIDREWAFYVGSPLPLNFGEESTPHGFWIVGDPIDRPTFLELSGPRFSSVRMTDDTVTWTDGVPPQDADVLRVYVTHGADLRATREYAEKTWEPWRLRIIEMPSQDRPRARIAEVDEHTTEADALSKWTESQEIDKEAANAMQIAMAGYLAETT